MPLKKLNPPDDRHRIVLRKLDREDSSILITECPNKSGLYHVSFATIHDTFTNAFDFDYDINLTGETEMQMIKAVVEGCARRLISLAEEELAELKTRGYHAN